MLLLLSFSKLTFTKKIRKTIRLSNSLDSDQDRRFVAKVIGSRLKMSLARKELTPICICFTH